MAAQRRDKAKDFLVDEYIKALSEDRIPWAKGWEENEYGKIRNGISNRPYQRTNALILTHVSMQRGYTDPRWYTYNQAKSKGYQVRRGEKSVPVSFPMLFRNNQRISLEEYNQLPEADKKNVYWNFRNYNLFNAEQIDGVPKPEENKTVSRQIEGSKLVEDIRSGMGIRLKHFGDQPCYNPLLDVVIVPDKEQFLSEEDYNATVLHELCHGTGHASRLNRDLGGSFGSEKYAREELRAEIASSFLMQSLQLRMPEAHIDNHKAYIQSWIQVLKKDPDELFKAIADAADIEKYALEKGGIDLDKLVEEAEETRELSPAEEQWSTLQKYAASQESVTPDQQQPVFRELMETMQSKTDGSPSEYLKVCQEAEKQSVSEKITSPKEMLARAFASWAQEKGMAGADALLKVHPGPLPEGAEKMQIDLLMNDFVNDLQEKGILQKPQPEQGREEENHPAKTREDDFEMEM